MKYKILLIDDDEIIITSLSHYLKKYYDVITASDGETGIKIIDEKSNEIDLVITDYDMPGISGLEVINHIKDNYCKLPVIMLTAIDDIGLIIKSMQLGASDYIEKKKFTYQIVDSIQNVIGKDDNYVKIGNRKEIEENSVIENLSKIAKFGNSRKIISKLNYHKDIEILPVYGILKKQIFDFFISLLIILISSPFLILISLLIKLTSKGPIIFKQKRIGYQGEEFVLYKFRTMVHNADSLKMDLMNLNEADGPVFKIKKDPRINKIGTFLRKTGLDEFPQFFNVIKGDMSIIGPRPSLHSEIVHYKKKYFLRLLVKPGISCIWQIQKNRNNIKFEEWMNLDMEYINNWSMKQDIKIFFKTFFTVFGGRGM